MELIKIINARAALNCFADKENTPVRLAYKMAKFIATTEADHSFYAERVKKTVDQYAEKTDDESIVVPKEKIDEFNSAIESINRLDVAPPEIRFNLSEFSDALKASMKQIYPLIDFIDDDQ